MEFLVFLPSVCLMKGINKTYPWLVAGISPDFGHLLSSAGFMKFHALTLLVKEYYQTESSGSTIDLYQLCKYNNTD